MESLQGKKVWVVMETYRSKHTDETTDCLSICATQEGAEEVVKGQKDYINQLWSGEDAFIEDENGEMVLNTDDSWDIEEDRPTCYTLARICDYEYYYSVWAFEKTIE